MIGFPNAKINLGLNVLEKREDGYHNIESIFYPVNWCDGVEVIQTKGNGSLNLANYGIPIPGSSESNLCVKTFNLLNTKYKLPSINLGLLKSIPMGAGLGGGSSDAAFLLKMLNELFQLQLSNEDLKLYASQIGSDCTFFVENKPALVSEKGNVITPIELDLSKYYISIIYPKIHVDTKNAYSLIKPSKRPNSLKDLVKFPIHRWEKTIINDFEAPVFNIHPQLPEIKTLLYDEGAIYASMTGSGSALYGIFENKPQLTNAFSSYKVWTNPPVKVV